MRRGWRIPVFWSEGEGDFCVVMKRPETGDWRYADGWVVIFEDLSWKEISCARLNRMLSKEGRQGNDGLPKIGLG
jgi:hypothetical protein